MNSIFGIHFNINDLQDESRSLEKSKFENFETFVKQHNVGFQKYHKTLKISKNVQSLLFKEIQKNSPGDPRDPMDSVS